MTDKLPVYKIQTDTRRSPILRGYFVRGKSIYNISASDVGNLIKNITLIIIITKIMHQIEHSTQYKPTKKMPIAKPMRITVSNRMISTH